MNICLLCRNFHKDVGGIETFTAHYAKALAHAGHSVHVLCQDQGDLNRGRLGQNIFVHHVPFHDDPFPGAWTIERFLPLNDLRYSKAVAKKIEAVQSAYALDIVETFDYFRQGFIYARRRHRLPVFFRLHGWFFNRTEGRTDPWPTLSVKERISWAMQRNTLLKADGVAAVAADTADFVKQVWRTDRKIPTIYNAVDAGSFSPEGEKDPCQILFSGRLIPRKGIDVLAQAMPLVIKEFPGVKLAVAGADAASPDGTQNSQMLLHRIGRRHVQYLGSLAQDQLKAWLKKSSILIMPSLDEAFPLSALEAMASGCALIASTAGGLKELIDHEKDGLLVDPGDAAQLAKAILRLLEDEALRHKLAANGLKKVRTAYSYPRLVEESLKAYQEAIKVHKNSNGHGFR
jgi:glycosyltransferase involved in cell wall biosynthesis